MSSTISAGGAPSPEETVVMERSRAARILDWRPASALARIVIVLCLVIPLLLAATFMWSMWDPAKTLPNVPLAVVNEDKGAENGGEFQVVGDQVVQGLLETEYLDFEELPADEAQLGLTKGDYLFVVTIPEDFSERTVSLITDNPRQSEVLVEYNDYGGTNGKIITSSLIPQLQAEISSTISETYATETLTGLNSLGDGIKRAADGAGQIDDGLGRLQDGAGRAVDGINQLDSGATDLNDGAVQLDAGASELNSGAGELNDGARRLEDGAYQLNDGLVTLKDGTTQLGDGAAQIDAGVQELTGTLIPILEQAQGIVTQVTPVIGTLRSLGLNDQAAQIESAISRIDPANPANIVNDLNRLRAGTAELSYNLNSPDAPYISGVNQLIDGSQQLASGSTELLDGTDRLLEGTGRLKDGTTQLADGTVRLKDGTTQLTDGGTQLADGVQQLKDGSGELKSKLDEGAAQAPVVSYVDRSAQQMAVPIIFEEANMHPTQELVDPANPTVKSIESGFSIIIMLVFGYLVMAILSALLPHVVGRRSESRTGAGPVLRALAMIFGINLLVMGIFTALSVVLGWRPDNWLSMGAVILLIAASGAAMFQLFRILFGRLVGGLFSIGVFALGLFVFGGVWPLPTIPGPLQFMHNLHPMSYARYAFIRATDGLYDGRYWASLLVLLAVTVLAAIASIIIYNVRRQGVAQALEEDEVVVTTTDRRVGEEPLDPIIR
ncbi:YhgE/Pip domain-containing protein [Corynebacterium sanguinis]|uniref:YhgE/Pip domain-containing protein n=2 Tax=Corynebacterium sanguinis TaxID=2594913 RepID=UPI00223C18F9|nr:YhgE/Pip domain-containing protein [Corynebacterium sanguinis]MCT1556252.1 YhgE/Pip domain-containing protein [Corynebacterium sanguinis]